MGGRNTRRSTGVTRGAAALAALLLTGCAAYSDSATNGPVTVTLAEPATIAAACRTITREAGAWGCMARYPSGHVSILCPPIAECLAHEIRHALEPGWRHE